MPAPHTLVVLAALAAASPAAPRPHAAPSIYDFQLKRIDGHAASLAAYKGKVMLIVNTASKCGFTPQYAGLEKLHERYVGKGLAVLGFPANQFLAQEPGTNTEIHQFCMMNYGVKFDMFEKSVVKGEGQSPLYRYLTSKETDPAFAGEIPWNFTKFLVDRHGAIVARFAPNVSPSDPKLVSAVEHALAQR
jgi:glutathione peroxidase